MGATDSLASARELVVRKVLEYLLETEYSERESMTVLCASLFVDSEDRGALRLPDQMSAKTGQMQGGMRESIESKDRARSADPSQRNEGDEEHGEDRTNSASRPDAPFTVLSRLVRGDNQSVHLVQPTVVEIDGGDLTDAIETVAESLQARDDSEGPEDPLAVTWEGGDFIVMFDGSTPATEVEDSATHKIHVVHDVVTVVVFPQGHPEYDGVLGDLESSDNEDMGSADDADSQGDAVEEKQSVT